MDVDNDQNPNSTMKSRLRYLFFTASMLLGGGTFAQLQYWAQVYGQVQNCTPGQVITLTTSFQTVTTTVDANCYYWADVYTAQDPDVLLVSTPCQGTIQTVTDTITFDSVLDSALVYINFNCSGGVQLDCLGIPDGPNTAGTPCTQPATGLTGYWNSACECESDTSSTECSADFWVMQAYTYGDSINNPNGGGAEPIPNEVWVWNLSSGGTPPYTYLWSFGDGTSSVDPYPTHVYANGGPYQLCLTIADAEGCTSTYCDDVSVDDNGIYTGLIVDGRPGMLRSGFTIRVISELPMAVAERNVVEEVSMWPNPVEDIIGLSFNSSRNANLILSIVDLNGRMIRSSNSAVNVGNNRHSISVADLEAGMYLLQISDGAQSTSRRFVKN
jgi:hypothetical protein